MNTIVGTKAAVQELALSPDGRWLAAQFANKGYGIWELATRERVFWYESDAYRTGLEFLADNERLIAWNYDGPASIVKWPNPTPMRFPSDGSGTQLGWLCVSTDGQWIATHHRSRSPSIELRRVVPGKLRPERVWRQLAGREFLWTLAFAPDNEFLLVVQDARTGGRHVVRMLELATGKIVEEFPTQLNFVRAAVLPGNQSLLLRTWDQLTLWDRTTKTQTHSFRPLNSKGKFDSVSIHPRGHLAAVTVGTRLAILQTTDWQPIQVFEWKLGRMTSVRFSPDGSTVAAGSAQGKIIVWDVDL